MSPDTRPAAGRLFLEALRLDRESRDAVRRRIENALELDVGGFLLFGAEADGAARLLEEIRGSAAEPLWLAADLERGAGQQFRGLTTFPPPAGLASHPEPTATVRQAARCTAREARALGLNLILAPVLDLDIEPRNPIVGTRSFGSDPERVAALGAAWIEACQAEGVAACAKHFPGHGRTTIDSHAGLPVVDASREVLEADLLPFRSAARGVACMMTAHVAFPSLGGNGPATLEKPILRGLLRAEMGFEGLILTDALNMSGVRTGRAGGPGRPAEALETAALRAGCDLLLYPPDLATAIRSVEENADASEEVAVWLREAATRSGRVRRRCVRSGEAVAPAVGEASKPCRVPDSAAEAIAAACVRGVGWENPRWLRPHAPVTVSAIWDDREDLAREPFGEPFRRALQTAGWAVARPGAADPAAPLIVLVAATPQAWKGTASLTDTGRAAVHGALSHERVLPVVFGHPRILEELGRPGLCAWAAEPAMERAVARRLDELVRGEG